MKTQKTLVVYYSNSGFTKKLASELSRKLNSDIEEIKTSAIYTGFFGYLRALAHSLLKQEPLIKQFKHNPADYDVVIVGGPVWAGSLSGPVRTFLDSYKNNLKHVAFFLTQGSPVSKLKVFNQMGKIIGKNPLANLSVSDKELNDGTFVQKTSTFLSNFQIEKPI